MDFEDGNLDEWSGSMDGGITVQEEVASQGSMALRHAARDAYAYSLAGDGLDAYPRPGDTFSFEVRDEHPGWWLEFQFGLQSDPTSNGQEEYRGEYNSIQVHVSSGNIQAHAPTFEEDVQLGDTVDAPLEPFVWYKVTVEWAFDNSMTVTISDPSGEELATLDVPASDAAYGAGGVGTYTLADNFYVDNIRIEESLARDDDGNVDV